MISQFYPLVYGNKTFENPILGKVSCEVFGQSVQQCKEHAGLYDKKYACAQLKQLMTQCYKSKDIDEINKKIMSEFKQAYTTISFFQKRDSKLPDKLLKNTWSVFYNRNNLKKYQKYSQLKQKIEGIKI